MVLEKIHSKNNVLFFSILCLVSNIAILTTLLTINVISKGMTDNLNAQFAEQERNLNNRMNADRMRFPSFGGIDTTQHQSPPKIKVDFKLNSGFNVVGSLIVALFLIMNLFLFLGIIHGKQNFIKTWIIFRLVLAALATIGAVIYSIMVPIAMSSLMSGWLALPPIVLIYCYIGFYLFEVSTVYIYLKELRNEIINIHLKSKNSGLDYI